MFVQNRCLGALINKKNVGKKSDQLLNVVDGQIFYNVDKNTSYISATYATVCFFANTCILRDMKAVRIGMF